MPHLYYDPWTNAAAIFGIIMAGLIVFLLIAALVIGFVVAWRVWAPFFHIGKPAGIGELNFYDRGEILSLKSGGQREPSGRGRCAQKLSLRWWLGVSSPRKAKWFIGFIRWDEAQS